VIRKAYAAIKADLDERLHATLRPLRAVKKSLEPKMLAGST